MKILSVLSSIGAPPLIVDCTRFSAQLGQHIEGNLLPHVILLSHVLCSRSFAGCSGLMPHEHSMEFELSNLIGPSDEAMFQLLQSHSMKDMYGTFTAIEFGVAHELSQVGGHQVFDSWLFSIHNCIYLLMKRGTDRKW